MCFLVWAQPVTLIHLVVIIDTKLTPFLLECPKLLGYEPIFLQLFFWQYHIFSMQHIGTLVSCVIVILFHFVLVFRLYLDVTVAVPKNITWQLLSLCVYLSQSWILYLIVDSYRVSYVNSDSHQMCNIFVKYCSTVIATLFFESAFVIFMTF